MTRPSPDPDFILRGSEDPITCVALIGEELLTGTQAGEVLTWDLKSRRIRHKHQAHKGQLTLLTRLRSPYAL